MLFGTCRSHRGPRANLLQGRLHAGVCGAVLPLLGHQALAHTEQRCSVCHPGQDSSRHGRLSGELSGRPVSGGPKG